MFYWSSEMIVGVLTLVVSSFIWVIICKLLIKYHCWKNCKICKWVQKTEKGGKHVR